MRTIFRFILILTLISIIHAEINFGAGINTYYSDNIFLNSTAISDFVNVFSADINYTSKHYNFYFDGDFSMFAENSDFNSYRIEPGIEMLKYLKGRNYIYFNISYPVLAYSDYYTDFNYNGPTAEAGFKYYLSPSLLFKSGYNLEVRTYPNFASFDFSNHTLFIELSKFFSSQTTIRLQTGFNYRFYRHIAKIIPEADWSIDPDKNSVNSMSVPNVSGILRISQGIGSRFGIYGESELRKNFRGLDEAETLINNSYVIYPYNDNYLWDGTRITFGVRFIPFAEIAVSGNISFMDKHYPGVYVMDEDGLVEDPKTERKDKLFLLDISVSKKFRKLNTYLRFVFRDNSSADFFFDYQMLTLSAGISYYF